MATLALVLPTLAGPAAASGSGTRGSVAGRIDERINESGLQDAVVSVHVIEGSNGNLESETLASIRSERVKPGDRPWMIPASNMKLLTTGAALVGLGADFRFETRLVRDGDRLIVIGDGDPAFGDPELLAQMGTDGLGISSDQFLEYWVRAVEATGMQRVREVIVDDRIFDEQFVHPDWPRDQLNRTYCAQVSGLNFHSNIVNFYPRPNAPYQPIWDRFEPRLEWLEPVNKSRSGTKGETNTVWIARKLGTNELTFFNTVRHPYKNHAVSVTLHDMPDVFARLLTMRLRDAGIEVGGFRSATWDDPPSDGETLGPPIYTPLTLALERCNRESINLYAESLLKRVGHAKTGQPGSWSNGAAVVRQTVLECVGSPEIASGLRIADGSGLSRNDRVTPQLMTAWLNWFHEQEQAGRAVGRVFIDSLAVAGVHGTLDDRMKWSPQSTIGSVVVQAKTGYINGVSCLSGYVSLERSDGTTRRRCFSIMVNEIRSGNVWKAKRLQDHIVRDIAEDMVESAIASAEVNLGS